MQPSGLGKHRPGAIFHRFPTETRWDAPLYRMAGFRQRWAISSA
jgi:hypothetical protein